MRLLLLLPLTLLVACGSTGGSDDVVAPGEDLAAGGSISRAENDLAVEIDPGEGAAVLRYSLTCVGFVEGDHPRAEQACAHLKGLPDPFAALPVDAVCTQVYGGPQTARVTGLWGGQPVDLTLARNDGCRIEQWDSLGPLLDGPGAGTGA